MLDDQDRQDLENAAHAASGSYGGGMGAAPGGMGAGGPGWGGGGGSSIGGMGAAPGGMGAGGPGHPMGGGGGSSIGGMGAAPGGMGAGGPGWGGGGTSLGGGGNYGGGGASGNDRGFGGSPEMGGRSYGGVTGGGQSAGGWGGGYSPGQNITGSSGTGTLGGGLFSGSVPKPGINPFRDPSRFTFKTNPDRMFAPKAGYPEVDQSVLSRLANMQSLLGRPIHIRDVVPLGLGSRNRTSQHFLGNAVDINVAPNPQATLDAIAAAGQMGFTGIGQYKPGSLHLDIGPPRAWGPNRSKSSLHEPYKSAQLQAIRGGYGEPDMERIAGLTAAARGPVTGRVADTFAQPQPDTLQSTGFQPTTSRPTISQSTGFQPTNPQPANVYSLPGDSVRPVQPQSIPAANVNAPVITGTDITDAGDTFSGGAGTNVFGGEPRQAQPVTTTGVQPSAPRTSISRTAPSEADIERNASFMGAPPSSGRGGPGWPASDLPQGQGGTQRDEPMVNRLPPGLLEERLAQAGSGDGGGGGGGGGGNQGQGRHPYIKLYGTRNKPPFRWELPPGLLGLFPQYAETYKQELT